MRIQEIKDYLKRHHYLIFRYKSDFYSLIRNKYLFYQTYSLVPTDGFPQKRRTIEELYICNGILLIDAVDDIDIPAWDDPIWETYEAIRHCAIIYGNEIHFSYKGVGYWITQTNDGRCYLSDSFENTQSFDSCRELFDRPCVDGCTLKDIWDKVTVDHC